MPRRKIKRVTIANEKLRKETFEKRLANFFKKAHELSKLCDSAIYIVVHDIKSGISTLWPEEEDFYQGLTKFMSLPDAEKTKKMVLHLDFLEELVSDLDQKLKRLQKKNCEDEMEMLTNQLLESMNVNEIDISKFDLLSSHVDEKIMKLQQRMGAFDEERQGAPSHHLPEGPERLLPQPAGDGQTSDVASTSGVHDMRNDELFLETMTNNFGH